MRKIIYFIFTAIIFISLANRAFTSDRDVCPTCPYTTIQSAIDATANGDRIRVAQGIYFEHLSIYNPKNIIISGGWSADFNTQVNNPSLTTVDADRSWRALYIGGGPSDILIENMTFQNGSVGSGNFGGGVWVVGNGYDINVNFQDVIIQDCDSTVAHGGGISFLALNHTLTSRLTNVIVRRNHAGSAGGGISVLTDFYSGLGKAEVYILNSLIYSNTAEREAGGIHVWAEEKAYTRVVIINSTITGNTSNNTYLGGGGVVINGDADPESTSILEVYNTIIYGNTAAPGKDLTVSLEGTQSKADVRYSTLGGVHYVQGPQRTFNQENNLTNDPLFVDPAGNNFHLQPTSTLIDAGTSSVPSPPDLPSTDLEGYPRVIRTAPDIGAYEWTPVSPAGGAIGTEISITGSGYGARRGRVSIGTAALKILTWTDELIHGQLTKALPAGTYDVKIQPQFRGAVPIVIEHGFVVLPPEIDSVDPTIGSFNEQITLKGYYFGTKRGKVTLGGKNCRVLSWTMDPGTGGSEVNFVVPRGLIPGDHELNIINGTGSDTVNFKVD